MNKNLLLQPSLIEQLNQYLDGDDFKDFIIKLNDYVMNGVIPEFDGVKKILFDSNKPYYDYLNSKWYSYLERREINSLGLETIDDFTCNHEPTIPVNKRYKFK